ncbi:hypothetical protein GCM10023201_01510 [Actinomycetospora corticicola]|uniref:Uncharacterized protein n=1 Tax=Actinomycetospora corticicola TaxID=663602 RepID=A0A7Y9E180_9PSEU|nr:hypothetical protein [Actinomycetospora corticicola]NYD39254.1 hypothetical protein [Actinomycetospora corticicola]
MRPSDLRAQADEMAALLEEAAPRSRRQRRRRSTALPAAVAAFGALSVGGVGLALGLTPTGVEGQLPAAPSPVLADPATDLPVTTTAGGGPATVDLDPAVAGAELVRPAERPGSVDRPAPSSGTPRSTTTTSTTTSTTPTTTRTTRTRPTRPPRPTVTRSATPRSTTTTPPATAAPRRVAETSALAPSGTVEEPAEDPTVAEPAPGGTTRPVDDPVDAAAVPDE